MFENQLIKKNNKATNFDLWPFCVKIYLKGGQEVYCSPLSMTNDWLILNILTDSWLQGNCVCVCVCVLMPGAGILSDESL